jgi:tetratricopeptide (TPR) repeat protein
VHIKVHAEDAHASVIVDVDGVRKSWWEDDPAVLKPIGEEWASLASNQIGLASQGARVRFRRLLLRVNEGSADYEYGRHFQKGQELYSQNDLEGALSWFAKAIAFNQSHLIAIEWRTWIHCVLGKWKTAEEGYHRCIELNPDDFEPRFYRAIVQLQLHGTERFCRECYDLMNRFETSNKERASQLARLVFARACAGGTHEGFAEYLLVAKQIAPQLPNFSDFHPGGRNWLNHIVTGALMYRTGEFKEAIRLLQSADPNEEDQAFWPRCAFLALAHAKLGNSAEAKTYLDKTVEVFEKAESLTTLELRYGNISWDQQILLRSVLEEAKALIDQEKKSEFPGAQTD